MWEVTRMKWIRYDCLLKLITSPTVAFNLKRGPLYRLAYRFAYYLPSTARLASLKMPGIGENEASLVQVIVWLSVLTVQRQSNLLTSCMRCFKIILFPPLLFLCLIFTGLYCLQWKENSCWYIVAKLQGPLAMVLYDTVEHPPHRDLYNAAKPYNRFSLIMFDYHRFLTIDGRYL